YRCHLRSLPGRPDIAFTRWRVAVFVDGVYWHGHPEHYTFGRLGDYWDTKVRRTQARDRAQEAALVEARFKVVRFWDLDVKGDADACAAAVLDVLRAQGREARPPGTH